MPQLDNYTEMIRRQDGGECLNVTSLANKTIESEF